MVSHPARAAHCFAGRKHYAPMDAAALRPLPHPASRLGIFPVEIEFRARRQPTSCARAHKPSLLSGGVLWITPQGQLRRCARPPARLQARSGCTRRPQVGRNCTLLPLAIEYTFWDERLPEALLHLRRSRCASSAESASTTRASALEILRAALKRPPCSSSEKKRLTARDRRRSSNSRCYVELEAARAASTALIAQRLQIALPFDGRIGPSTRPPATSRPPSDHHPHLRLHSGRHAVRPRAGSALLHQSAPLPSAPACQRCSSTGLRPHPRAQ